MARRWAKNWVRDKVKLKRVSEPQRRGIHPADAAPLLAAIKADTSQCDRPVNDNGLTDG